MAERDVAADNAIVRFQVGESAVRGRVIRLGRTIDEILTRHQFPDALSELLGEAACVVSMMGVALKFNGKLIFQAQGDGPVSMLVADYAASGGLRATASVKGEINDRGAKALLGKGHIAMTIDQGPDMERYQGVTPIEGDSLAEAAVAYFDQSEQIPTVVKLAVGKIARPGEPERWRAGGIMAQFIPSEGGTRERGEDVLMSEQDREDWERAAAFIETTQDDELLDPEISIDQLLYRLFHEDGVRVYEPHPVEAVCSCNSDKIAAVLKSYGEEELADMVEGGVICVTCEFCRKNFYFTPGGDPAPAPS